MFYLQTKSGLEAFKCPPEQHVALLHDLWRMNSILAGHVLHAMHALGLELQEFQQSS